MKNITPGRPDEVQQRDKELQTKKQRIADQKSLLKDALAVLIGNKQKDLIEEWLSATETEDIEKEYRGLLAAAKCLAPLSEDYARGIEVSRRVLGDMAKNLQVNEKRDRQVKKHLQQIVNMLKKWDQVKNKEQQIERLEKSLESFK